MKNRSNSLCGRTLRLATYTIALPLLCLVISATAHAQTLTTLANFNGTNGSYPSTQLVATKYTHHWVQHTNGNFYGTAPFGGSNTTANGGLGAGTVFQVTPSGALTVIYNFCSIGGSACTDGSTPQGALALGTDGNLYGTTYLGGAHGVGTVFKITTSGALTTLYNFGSQANNADGANPYGALTLGNDGNLYGNTFAGGAKNDGAAFKITCGGSLTVLHSFSGSDGANPEGDMLQASNGNFYGVTLTGGNSTSSGTLFEMTTSGSLTTLWDFCSTVNCNDGSSPNVPLAQDSLGDVYGTSAGNGANSQGTIFTYTWWGGFHTIYHFCALSNCTDGSQPIGGPIVASDFNIYGTTATGGAHNAGSVYQFTPWHQLTTLYSFCSKTNCADGETPESALVQGTNGQFYGTTSFGGTSNEGTAYQLSTIPPNGGACNGTYSSNYVGNIYISSGQNCEFTGGATIFGNVYETGGTLTLSNATVLGNVQIEGGTYNLGPSLAISSKLEVSNVPSGSTTNNICGVNVNGSFYYDANGSPAQIGSSAGSCPGNTIGGDLEFDSNTSSVQGFNNKVNSNINCSGNTGTLTGGGNTASSKNGQCSSF
jgi:uncharacterized repeat protein (TIGR03803 family)